MAEPKRKKVLIVEDTDSVLMVMKRWVGNMGYDVITAEDGREALEKVRKDPPDMVLLDVMMPEMNGFAVCRELRSYDTMKKIPIVIVTALPASADSDEAKMSGANEVVIKPVTQSDLTRRVRHYLGSAFK
ncbi:MAG: response regulator [Bacteroidota bacterium]